eukprot:13551258-Heterocapsa_arctica.AAC.1
MQEAYNEFVFYKEYEEYLERCVDAAKNTKFEIKTVTAMKDKLGIKYPEEREINITCPEEGEIDINFGKIVMKVGIMLMAEAERKAYK